MIKINYLSACEKKTRLIKFFGEIKKKKKVAFNQMITRRKINSRFGLCIFQLNIYVCAYACAV